MPPLKGIDRGIDGKLLCALEEAGHGFQIAVVDPSYPIPGHARVLDYHGNSAGNTSAQALRGILELVPTEKIDDDGNTILAMGHDDIDRSTPAQTQFVKVGHEFGMATRVVGRNDEVLGGTPVEGFYSRANNPDRYTIFVRTRDEQAYACAMFVVGHSQTAS
jgi:L-fucose mutarotase/ribose pyranase (RbsD/FucU family)